jgi:hypothetical protein
MSDGYSLNWKGDEVKRQVIENSAKAMSEFGLRVEAESKKQLKRGHGVMTGTLRRSIHSAQPGYDWAGDDVEPSKGTSELGGQQVSLEPDGDQVTVEVGSGLVYAMAVHQGHDYWTGYHYLTIGLAFAKDKLDSILRKYKVQR